LKPDSGLSSAVIAVAEETPPGLPAEGRIVLAWGFQATAGVLGAGARPFLCKAEMNAKLAGAAPQVLSV
jgi:hypothetical protein